MIYGELRRLIMLHQGERGAGHILNHAERLQHGTSQCGLPCAKIAGQRHGIARFQAGGNVRAQRLGRRLIRKRDFPHEALGFALHRQALSGPHSSLQRKPTAG